MLRILKHLPGIWVFFIFVSLVSAQPPLPNLFWGTAAIDGTSAQNGSIVTVHNASGDILGISKTISGYYAIDFFCNEGENLYFRIYDVPVLEGSVLCKAPGSTTKYNISINRLENGAACSYSEACQSGICLHGFCRPESPYCGDGYCDEGESCSSCSQDCGTCPTGGGKKTGGGGTGGGGFSEYCGNGKCAETENCSTCPHDCGICPELLETGGCQENWVCSVWSECQPNGKQTRTCIDKNNCGTEENKPKETRDCVYVEKKTEQGEKEEEAPNATTTQPSVNITGLVIGNPSFWAGLIIILVGLGFIFYRKKKKK